MHERLLWSVGSRIGVFIILITFLPAYVYAQEAVISGTVIDSTGGVLPGVTVTAVHNATGNTFVAVTDERGNFRLPVRTGVHKLTLELAGFATVSRTIDLLVNQQTVVNLQMAPSTLQETVTVTGEAPLIDTAKSEVGGNIDPRQLQDLPVNGRNWLDLAMLAPGSRQNATSDTLGGRDYQFQINIDGQQVTQLFAGSFGQPRYSREAIAEFQFVASRFDASQGRSSGQQLNAITKSGTNTPAGSFSGYFRDDKFNAKDFLQKRVLPYSNQQLAWTYGGPIRKDRVHFFGDFEYEREPSTFTYTSPYPAFNIDQSSVKNERKGGARVDFQFSPRTRLAIRWNKAHLIVPIDDRFSGGATRHPSSAITSSRDTNNLQGTLTQVLTNATVNEVRIGYAGYFLGQDPSVKWSNHPVAAIRTIGGTPILQFRGYTVGQGHQNSPIRGDQKPYNFRDDVTWSHNAHGRHNVKVGGEYIYNTQTVFVCNFCQGTWDFQGGPVPANIESLIANWRDPNTWDISGLSSIARFYRIDVGQFEVKPKRHYFSGWVQDDWNTTQKLTLNLGLRYDFGTGTLNEVLFAPFITTPPSADRNNLGPRAGFAYSLNDRTVLRGGAGKYFAAENENTVFWTLLTTKKVSVQPLNTPARADFTVNPFNGPIPTYEQALDMQRRGLIRRSASPLTDPNYQTAYSWQSSLGVQRQLGDVMALEADWVWVQNYALERTTDVNLAYNLATGYNYPFNNPATRPVAGWDSVNESLNRGEDRNHSLQLALTRRMRNRWQASATYLLFAEWEHQELQAPPGCSQPWTISASGAFQCNVALTNVHPDLRDQWYRTPAQMRRATFNGIWDVGLGFQLSGLYFYGDNGKATPTSGVDPLATGSTNLAVGSLSGRVRANGTLIERNSFDRPSLHRVDMRLQRRFRVGGRVTFDAMAELFNAFNHKNFNAFVTNEASPLYGRPSADTNLAFQPRMAQFGFRAMF